VAVVADSGTVNIMHYLEVLEIRPEYMRPPPIAFWSMSALRRIVFELMRLYIGREIW
jgi:hypothetical protein